MEKTDFNTIDLGKGKMRVYERNNIKLHAYQTCDLIDDEVFIIEKDGRGIVIEYPCFFDNIQELTRYLEDHKIEIEGILAAYHMAGATFLPDTPVYATASADQYGHEGGGRALIDNFATNFGDAFDSSLPTVTNTLEAGPVTIAGIMLNITPNDEAYDIEIPELNAFYLHMLGHDCHSIVPGAAAANALIAQLEELLAHGYDLVLTSHYTPEDLKDVQTKIDYLNALKEIAAQSTDALDFKKKVEAQYPHYAGQNYLDMTASFFFPEN